MRIHTTLLISAYALTLGSCGTDSTTDGVKELANICLSSTNMGPELCDCISKKASEELSPSGFEYTLATMKKDQTKIKEIASTMDIAEMAPAAMFMLKTPSKCAKEGLSK